MSEPEWQTRKRIIDPRLDAAGWRFASLPASGQHRREEHPTSAGPADYVLCDGDHVLAVVEAKRPTTNPQEVLTQAERYSRALTPSPHDFDGHRVPFLYSTNGEVIWFRDVRHPLNRARKVAAFHTPTALAELLAHDIAGVSARLLATPNDNTRLRDYQRETNGAVETAIAERKRSMLLAMATGTGKTFTAVNMVYRLLKAGAVRRVLFLVDRRALAAQAVRAFAAYDTGANQKFKQVYDVFSNRFQKGDLEDGEPFDPEILPESHLVDPRPNHTFVYVCTIQRMAINVFGRAAVLGDDEPIDDEADRLDIPIHAFDLIIADECHRGYTAQQQSLWRETLDHFDGIKIGLTATPASHTTSYFTHLVYRYTYEQAVREGHLVDYDAVKITSNVRMSGVFLEPGHEVEAVDTETGQTKLDTMEDERQYGAGDVEEKVTSPDSNLKILQEVKKYADAHEVRTGRQPKILIFAANDKPHASHADELCKIARDVWGRGDNYVAKITGRVDRPLQRIREFRNRPQPGIAVTVDLLSTGVDIPDLEFIVLLRALQSRILFVQIIGRGTRKGEKFKDKDRFVVFDCFDGTLLDYFAKATDMTMEPPVGPTRTIKQIIDDIWANKERDYNIRCLVKRLQRIEKTMSGDARSMFAEFVPDGDVGSYAKSLSKAIRDAFTEEMKRLRNPEFQKLLEDYPRANPAFLRALGHRDTVTSELLAGDRLGTEDYLESFAQFIASNRTQIEAFRALLDQPAGWSPRVLDELWEKLKTHPLRFNAKSLEHAYATRYKRPMVDIISMVKRAADGHAPLLTAAERVERVFAGLEARHTFTPAQRAWLSRIREHMAVNLAIEADEFEVVPVFTGPGGLHTARAAFGAAFDDLLRELNEGLAA